MREQKKEKLLQYGERVLNITSGTEEERIDLAISKTREFFESLGIQTRLSDYGVDESSIDDLVKQLEEHKMSAIGEDGIVTLGLSRKILEGAL